jgi:tetratricopeptide (TPR) repeat protein
MRNLIKVAVLQLVMLIWPVPNTFAENPRDPRFVSQAQTGFSQIYNMDYDDAMGTFALLHSQYPQHPAPPLYMATTAWLRELLSRDDLDLNKFVAPAYFDEPSVHEISAEMKQRFRSLIDESLALSTASLKKDPGDTDAKYFLASAYGIEAAFAITIDHSKIQAFEYGRKSYQLHSELIAKNPDYYDSYMTLGMYEYITGNLPWYVKWLARIAGYHGSAERGLQYLQLAAERGRFVADDSRVMLMVVQVRDRNYSQALENAKYLQTKYARSYILPVTRAQILEKMGARPEAAGIYENLIAWSDAGIANYDKLKSARSRYSIGRKFMDLDRYDLALPQITNSLNDPDVSAQQLALAWLAAGECLDMLDRHAEAVTDYRLVLSLKDFDGTHRQAKSYMAQPYHPASLR